MLNISMGLFVISVSSFVYSVHFPSVDWVSCASSVSVLSSSYILDMSSLVDKQLTDFHSWGASEVRYADLLPNNDLAKDSSLRLSCTLRGVITLQCP